MAHFYFLHTSMTRSTHLWMLEPMVQHWL